MARKKPTTRKKQRRRAAPSAPAEPPPLNEQLKSLFARLKRAHPNLLGIGVGYLRSGTKQTTQPVMSVRLIVAKKPPRGKPLPKHLKPLPQYVYLRALALGHPVRVRVPVDVEGAPRSAQSSGFAVHNLRAAAYIVWKENGALKSGVLTAAHGFEELNQVVGIEGNGGNPAGRVCALSDWKTNGIDCAVVEIDRADPRLMDAGPPLPAEPPPIDELIIALGDSQDNLECPGKFWGFPAEAPVSAIAYYAAYPMNYPNGRVVTLTDVAECAPTTAKFQTGQSGSLWSAQLSPGSDSPLAVQSHMVSNGKRAFGCVTGVVLDTVRSLLGDADARLVYTVAELRAAT